MSKTAVVTARIDVADLARVDAIARDLDRSRAWVVSRAVESYLKQQAELLAYVTVGLDDLAAGRVHSQAEVERRFGIEDGARDAA